LSSTKKGEHWTGKRWDKYCLAGRAYLDGTGPISFAGAAQVEAMERAAHGPSSSFSPAERDEMVKAIGDRIEVREALGNSYLGCRLQRHPPAL